MSNIQRFENLKQVVAQTQPAFDELAKIHGAVNYKREASFALQALTDNDYLASLAMGNQDSLKRAVINVAAIGLSLSPVHKLAYLVPRKKQVCLDLSYRGLIKLATDCGAIKWAVAEIVRKKDKFKRLGIGKEPLHEFSDFGERGEIVGVYCCVKTHDGDFLTTTMTIAEVYKIRDRSESFKSGKSNPWLTDPEEMIKKTVIRNAYKTWPLGDTRKRFDEAIDVTNEADTVEFTIPELPASESNEREEGLKALREGLSFLGRAEEKYIPHLATTYTREIKSLDDLTDIELSQAITAMTQWVEMKKSKDAEMAKLDAALGIEKEETNEQIAANQ